MKKPTTEQPKVAPQLPIHEKLVPAAKPISREQTYILGSLVYHIQDK